jgi:hypothetical protein
LFTVLGGKFKFSAQDSDLEYLFWRCKNPPVSSDLEPPLVKTDNLYFSKMFYNLVILYQNLSIIWHGRQFFFDDLINNILKQGRVFQK